MRNNKIRKSKKRSCWSLVLLLILNLVGSSSLLAQESEEQIVERLKEQIETQAAQVPYAAPRFGLTGTLHSTPGGYEVNGEVFSVNDDTQIIGELSSGVEVQVTGLIDTARKKTATLIVVRDRSEGERPTDLSRNRPNNH